MARIDLPMLGLEPGERVSGIEIGGEWVRVDETAQHFGGVRCWLLCPRCSRRQGALYATGASVGCRRCLGLLYRSQTLHPVDRYRHRAFELYRLLNVDYSRFPRQYGPRPEGMPYPKYYRLLTLARELDEKATTLSAGAFLTRYRRFS